MSSMPPPAIEPATATPPRAALDLAALALTILAHGALIGWAIMKPAPKLAEPAAPMLVSLLMTAASPAQPVPAAPMSEPITPPPPVEVVKAPAPEPVLATDKPAPVTTPPPTPKPKPKPQPKPEPSVEPVEPPPIETPEPRPAPAAAAKPISQDEMRRYLSSLMRQLNRHKTYPAALKQEKIEGKVILKFTIDASGNLISAKVQESSGHDELDQAALNMLARAAPLPAIPDFMERDQLTLSIPVDYSLITDR